LINTKAEFLPWLTTIPLTDFPTVNEAKPYSTPNLTTSSLEERSKFPFYFIFITLVNNNFPG